MDDKGERVARLAVIIHHTDEKREFAYDKDSKIGHLDQALRESESNGWIIVDMKKDWKKIYKSSS